MKTVSITLFFMGILMIVIGYYQNKLKRVSKKEKIKYKFIPRSYYDEQLSNDTTESHFSSLFDSNSPWFKSTVGDIKKKN